MITHCTGYKSLSSGRTCPQVETEHVHASPHRLVILVRTLFSAFLIPPTLLAQTHNGHGTLSNLSLPSWRIVFFGTHSIASQHAHGSQTLSPSLQKKTHTHTTSGECVVLFALSFSFSLSPPFSHTRCPFLLSFSLLSTPPSSARSILLHHYPVHTLHHLQSSIILSLSLSLSLTSPISTLFSTVPFLPPSLSHTHISHTHTSTSTQPLSPYRTHSQRVLHWRLASIVGVPFFFAPWSYHKHSWVRTKRLGCPYAALCVCEPIVLIIRHPFFVVALSLSSLGSPSFLSCLLLIVATFSLFSRAYSAALRV